MLGPDRVVTAQVAVGLEIQLALGGTLFGGGLRPQPTTFRAVVDDAEVVDLAGLRQRSLDHLHLDHGLVAVQIFEQQARLRVVLAVGERQAHLHHVGRQGRPVELEQRAVVELADLGAHVAHQLLLDHGIGACRAAEPGVQALGSERLDLLQGVGRRPGRPEVLIHGHFVAHPAAHELRDLLLRDGPRLVVADNPLAVLTRGLDGLPDRIPNAGRLAVGTVVKQLVDQQIRRAHRLCGRRDRRHVAERPVVLARSARTVARFPGSAGACCCGAYPLDR